MDYDDIIDRERPRHEAFARMPREARAAQLSAFAALTGYDDLIGESARVTDDGEELWTDKIVEINNLLVRMIVDNTVEAVVTWFVPDRSKSGGSYRSATGTLAKYDEEHGSIELSSGTVIPIESISDIVI